MQMNDDVVLHSHCCNYNVPECHLECTVVLMGDIKPDTKHHSLTPDIHILSKILFHCDPVIVMVKYMNIKV